MRSGLSRSLYVPRPRSALHGLHAMVKQAWLVCLLVVATRGTPTVRIAITAAVAALTAATLPRPLWEAQLKRLGLVAGFLFLVTAIGAGERPAGCTWCSTFCCSWSLQSARVSSLLGARDAVPYWDKERVRIKTRQADSSTLLFRLNSV